MIIRNLFDKWIPSGLLKNIEASLVFPHKFLGLLPVVIPLKAVDHHVLQLLLPQLHAVLSAVPLVLDLLHWREHDRKEFQKVTIRKGEKCLTPNLVQIRLSTGKAKEESSHTHFTEISICHNIQLTHF